MGMKATRHNGRAGKFGAYNVKHNDRNFDVSNSEHIDAERDVSIEQKVYRGRKQFIQCFFGENPIFR